MSILRKEHFLQEKQVARATTTGNRIESRDLLAHMAGPIAAHMVTSELANQHTLIPVTKADNKLWVATGEPFNLIAMREIPDSSEKVLRKESIGLTGSET